MHLPCRLTSEKRRPFTTTYKAFYDKKTSHTRRHQNDSQVQLSVVGVLGRHVTGNCNENGCMLLEFFSELSLTFTNIMSQQKERFKETWRYLWSKHWHLLVYVLIWQRGTLDVLNTRVMPSVDCYTHHSSTEIQKLLEKNAPITNTYCKCLITMPLILHTRMSVEFLKLQFFRER